jgi:hypothetical protein
MGENRRNVLEGIIETFNMTSNLPEDLDLEDPAMKAFLDSLPESRRNNFIAMVKDPDVRKMANISNAANGKYLDLVYHARELGKKVAFIPFNASPEIFHALDIVPAGVEVLNTFGSIMEENFNEYLDLSIERGLPDTMCSAQRGILGMLEAGLLEKPDILVNGGLGGCDSNSKIFEYMAEKFGIPILYLDLPFYHDQRSFDYYTNGYKQLVAGLEELSGNTLDEDRLREVCELSNQATEIFMEIDEMKRQVPNPVPNYYNLNHLSQKLTLVGTSDAVEFYKTAHDICRRRLENGAHVLPEERIRLMMMYTGVYFDQSLYFWFQEEMGVTYLLDMLVAHDFYPIIDTTNLESMLAGLAHGMLNLPMTRQLKGAWDMTANWLYDCLHYVDTYKADCLVFSGHTACKQAWGIYRLVAEEVKKQLGVPSLRLEGDGWDSRITPVSVVKEQLSEFFETLY